MAGLTGLPGYHLTVSDIAAWERQHGTIPEGAVVMVLKFLHERRRILFHGHEPLDTDTTPNLEGEVWLLRHGYTQAEGVANRVRCTGTNDREPEYGEQAHPGRAGGEKRGRDAPNIPAPQRLPEEHSMSADSDPPP